MFCSNCGIQLLEGAKFCQKCGTKVVIEGVADQITKIPEDNIMPGDSSAEKGHRTIADSKPIQEADSPTAVSHSQASTSVNSFPVNEDSGMEFMDDHVQAVQAGGQADTVIGLVASSAFTETAYQQDIASTVKKPKRKSRKLPVILGIIALIAIIGIIIAYMWEGETDYIGSVQAYEPFTASQGLPYTCGEVFDKYIPDAEWKVREFSDVTYVDISGMLKGTDIEAVITISITLDSQNPGLAFFVPESVVIDSKEVLTENDAVSFVMVLFVAYDEGYNDFRAIMDNYAEYVENPSNDIDFIGNSSNDADYVPWQSSELENIKTDTGIEAREESHVVYPEENGNGEGRLGDIMHTYFFDYTVNSAYLCDEYGGYTPAVGNEILVADVTIKNTVTSTLPMYDTDFQIQWNDTADDAYDFPITLQLGSVLNDQMLPGEYDLPIGKTINGLLVYEVPAGNRDFSISYLEMFDDNTTGNVFFVYFTAERK